MGLIFGDLKNMEIERVHLRFCKHFLGVGQSTSNEAVYGECGRYPLYINSVTKCIKYWLRLTELTEDRIAAHAYKLMFTMNDHGLQRLQIYVYMALSGCHKGWEIFHC